MMKKGNKKGKKGPKRRNQSVNMFHPEQDGANNSDEKTDLDDKANNDLWDLVKDEKDEDKDEVPNVFEVDHDNDKPVATVVKFGNDKQKTPTPGGPTPGEDKPQILVDKKDNEQLIGLSDPQKAAIAR